MHVKNTKTKRPTHIQAENKTETFCKYIDHKYYNNLESKWLTKGSNPRDIILLFNDAYLVQMTQFLTLLGV